MEFARSIFAGTAFALALASAQAADDKRASDAPGFNEMDKNDDGALTRSEARGNPQLLARFNEVDDDGDGKVSRYEYLKSVAVQDFTALREKVGGFINPDDKSATTGGTKDKR